MILKENFNFKISDKVIGKKINRTIVYTAKRIEKDANIYRISWDGGHNDFAGGSVIKNVKDGDWIIVEGQ